MIKLRDDGLSLDRGSALLPRAPRPAADEPASCREPIELHRTSAAPMRRSTATAGADAELEHAGGSAACRRARGLGPPTDGRRPAGHLRCRSAWVVRSQSSAPERQRRTWDLNFAPARPRWTRSPRWPGALRRRPRDAREFSRGPVAAVHGTTGRPFGGARASERSPYAYSSPSAGAHAARSCAGLCGSAASVGH